MLVFFGVIFILWCLYGSLNDTRQPFRHIGYKFGLIKRQLLPEPEHDRFDFE